MNREYEYPARKITLEQAVELERDKDVFIVRDKPGKEIMLYKNNHFYFNMDGSYVYIGTLRGENGK